MPVRIRRLAKMADEEGACIKARPLFPPRAPWLHLLSCLEVTA
jgi:hypothetical protein